MGAGSFILSIYLYGCMSLYWMRRAAQGRALIQNLGQIRPAGAGKPTTAQGFKQVKKCLSAQYYC